MEKLLTALILQINANFFSGKKASLESHAQAPLLRLINSKSTETRLNAIKALTLLAESPEGRSALLNYACDIEDRMHDIESEAVAKAARIAVKVITWKP